MPVNISKFQKILEDRKEELLSWNEQSKENSKPVELDQTLQGRLSRMDAIQQQEMARALESKRNRELEKINAAFQRIDNGDYGHCVDCDDEIAEKRLEIDPTAIFCIKCASKNRV